MKIKHSLKMKNHVFIWLMFPKWWKCFQINNTFFQLIMCFQLTICVIKLDLFLTLSYFVENPLNFWTENSHRCILIWFPVSGFLQKFDKLMISRPVTEIMHFEIETWKLLNFNLVIRCLFPRFKSWKFRNFPKLLSYPA